MQTFYDRECSPDKYAVRIRDQGHHRILGLFVEQYQLENSPVLEGACGRGLDQAWLEMRRVLRPNGPMFLSSDLVKLE